MLGSNGLLALKVIITNWLFFPYLWWYLQSYVVYNYVDMIIYNYADMIIYSYVDMIIYNYALLARIINGLLALKERHYNNA